METPLESDEVQGADGADGFEEQREAGEQEGGDAEGVEGEDVEPAAAPLTFLGGACCDAEGHCKKCPGQMKITISGIICISSRAMRRCVCLCVSLSWSVCVVDGRVCGGEGWRSGGGRSYPCAWPFCSLVESPLTTARDGEGGERESEKKCVIVHPIDYNLVDRNPIIPLVVAGDGAIVYARVLGHSAHHHFGSDLHIYPRQAQGSFLCLVLF